MEWYSPPNGRSAQPGYASIVVLWEFITAIGFAAYI